MSKLYNVGVYFGKFLPAHRGHLNQIINAATKCKTLYVAVSDNKHRTAELCAEAGIENIPAELRIQWLSQELQDLDHVKVILVDETDIPVYPNGWNEWANILHLEVGEFIDVFFCGEQEYADKLPHYFPASDVEVFDPSRTQYPISATEIRKNPLANWNYILGPARPHFAKRVLIVGTESCGKTTLTKYLAKIYHTSWSEEVGRYYAQKYLGGNETIFTDMDFARIAAQQFEQDYDALRHANRVCFFDTDATVTQYYSELYMGHSNPMVEMYIDPSKYDLVLFLHPDVEWVNDGQRLNGSQERREQLDSKLRKMFVDKGFANIIDIRGDYSERLSQAIEAINILTGGLI